MIKYFPGQRFAMMLFGRDQPLVAFGDGAAVPGGVENQGCALCAKGAIGNVGVWHHHTTAQSQIAERVGLYSSICWVGAVIAVDVDITRVVGKGGSVGQPC